MGLLVGRIENPNPTPGCLPDYILDWETRKVDGMNRPFINSYEVRMGNGVTDVPRAIDGTPLIWIPSHDSQIGKYVAVGVIVAILAIVFAPILILLAAFGVIFRTKKS